MMPRTLGSQRPLSDPKKHPTAAARPSRLLRCMELRANAGPSEGGLRSPFRTSCCPNGRRSAHAQEGRGLSGAAPGALYTNTKN